ncbi:NifB/NifX family molybdenum-iron cluster-binding protein [Vibrio metschnikovii]|nr:NifB/NifX family molybdenum-iron cluster-binding protein [Vibrio metschnikovii]
MIYAIPSQGQKLSPHFSKASEFLLINSVTEQHRVVITEPHDPAQRCAQKAALLELLRQHKVDAVIVKNIGQAMLSTLFKLGIKVFAYPARRSLAQLTLTELQEITDLAYARPSIHKHQKSCQTKQGCHSSQARTKLNPTTLKKLQRIFTIHR